MNSLELYIKDIKGALNNNLYFSVLALALTLPDICGKIMYPDLYTGPRYKKWYDEYKGKYEESPKNKEREIKMPYLSGEACYELRCAILHEGRNNIEDRKGTNISSIFEGVTSITFVPWASFHGVKYPIRYSGRLQQ